MLPVLHMATQDTNTDFQVVFSRTSLTLKAVTTELGFCAHVRVLMWENLGMKPYPGHLLPLLVLRLCPSIALPQDATASGFRKVPVNVKKPIAETILNPNSMRGLTTPWTLWINLSCGYEQWSHKKCFTIINFWFEWREMYLLKQSCLLLYAGAVFGQQGVGRMGHGFMSTPKFLTKLLALILHSVSPFVPWL